MLQSRKFKELRKPDGYPRRIETLGDQIKARRQELGLRQKDIANMLSVSTETVLGWEKNDHHPTIASLPAIEEFLGICEMVNRGDIAGLSLAESLIAARRSRGLILRQAATEMGIDPGTLSKYERGIALPHERITLLLESFLGDLHPRTDS